MSFGGSLKQSSQLFRRFALFIDGANVYASAKALGWEIDWDKVLVYYRKNDLVRAYYYTAIAEGESRLRPMVDYLAFNGYVLKTKPMKIFRDPVTGVVKEKGNVDMELALDALDISEFVTDIVIFTGDGDFRILVERLQQRGVRIHIVSTVKSDPPMCANELRAQCDYFVDLQDLQLIFRRDK
jgi:uncharacterized LabA/DUF88 family protein